MLEYFRLGIPFFTFSARERMVPEMGPFKQTRSRALPPPPSDSCVVTSKKPPHEEKKDIYTQTHTHTKNTHVADLATTSVQI